MNLLTRSIPLFVATATGAVGSAYLPVNGFEPAADTIVTFASFVAAAAVPAAILAATLLRANGLTIQELRAYRIALNEQLNFLFGLIAIATALVTVVIVGKMLGWAQYYQLLTQIWGWEIGISSSRVFNFVISFLAVLMTFRFYGFFVATKGMFSFYSNAVESEALQKEKAELTQRFDFQPTKDPRSEFGKIVKLKSPNDQN